MCRFIETVRVENGQICNADYHLQRIHTTRNYHWADALTFSWKEIESAIDVSVPQAKLRFIYDRKYVSEVTFTPYVTPQIRSLQLAEVFHADYSFKRVDRTLFQQLKLQYPTCDDVLIVCQGKITDTSFTNVAFFDGQRWLTPDTPLLAGTRRASLLAEGRIHEHPIGVADLVKYSHVALFNAMNDLGDIVLPIECIHGRL